MLRDNCKKELLGIDMVGVVVLSMLLIGIGLPSLMNDGSKLFTSTYSNDSYSRRTEPRYETRYEWVTIDSSYIDQRYGELFRRLDRNTPAISSSTGLNIDYQNIAISDWVKFCKLVNENDEFNTYAGQLLYSQYENDATQVNLIAETGVIKLINISYQYRLILKELGLKDQNAFYIKRKSEQFEKTLWYVGEQYKDCLCQNSSYKNLLKGYLSSGDFTTRQIIDWRDNVNFYDVVNKTINGSLYFWNYKQNKKFDEYEGKQPLKLTNGGARCWIQAGAQILISSTANDALNTLGNWGRFISKLADIQASDRNGTVEFLDVLKSFCSSAEFDLSEISREDVDKLLNELSKGEGYAQKSTDILLKIFPKLKQIKFDTDKTIFEQPCDPILSGGVATDKKTYLPGSIAVRHLIPNLKNVNAGIGADPVGENDTPNLYANYKIKYSIDNKLMIYELRGLALSEHLPDFRKTSVEETFDGIERYTVKPAIHARAVTKLDNSSFWHYCDSNGIYFMGKNLNDIFYNNKSVLDYVNMYKDDKPANHADLLMYELVG